MKIKMATKKVDTVAKTIKRNQKSKTIKVDSTRTRKSKGVFKGNKVSSIIFIYSLLLLAMWFFNLYVYDIPSSLVSTINILLTILVALIVLIALIKKKYQGKVIISPIFVNIALLVFLIYLARNLFLAFNGYNLIDVSSYANFPVVLYTALPILSIIFSVLVVNAISKKDTTVTAFLDHGFPKLLQGFVLFSIVLNAIFVSGLVFFKKAIVNNGGVLFYILKSALLGFGQKFSVQAILSMTLGNTVLSMIGFLLLSLYWFKLVFNFSKNKVIKVFAFIMAVIWLGLSLVLAISSYNLLALWVLGMLIFELIIFKQNFINKKLISKILFWVFGLLVLGGLIFLGFFIANQPIKSGAINLINVLVVQIQGFISWFKFVFGAKSFARLLSIKMPVLVLTLLGYMYGATSNILSLSNPIGIKLVNSYIFHFLSGFGVIGLLFIVYGGYLAVRYFIKSSSLISFVFLMIIFSIFFVPFSIWYAIVYMFTFVVLFHIVENSRFGLVTLPIYKSVSSFFWALSFVVFLIIYFNINLLKAVHYTNAYESKTLGDLNQVLLDYQKATKNKNSKKVSINSSHLNNFKLNFARYIYWHKKLEHLCFECHMSKITDFRMVQNLYTIAMQKPNLYNALVNAPNLEAKNQYISLVYNMQKMAWMPFEYKLLGDAWYGLNVSDKVPLFAIRASKDYERALLFYPLDSTVLQNYASILLKDYQNALKNNASNEVKASLEQRIKSILALLQESGIIKLRTTKNLDVLLNAVVLEAQYYKLNGNQKKAQDAFNSLKLLVKKLKMSNKNKDSILKFIEQIESKIIENNKQTKNGVQLNPDNNKTVKINSMD